MICLISNCSFIHFYYIIQIPAGAAKKELLDCIDQVPTYVQQLQFGVKNVTVGKTATFTKVDNVISETKNLMSVITRVVSACMNCAIKVCVCRKLFINIKQKFYFVFFICVVQFGYARGVTNSISNPFTILSKRYRNVL